MNLGLKERRIVLKWFDIAVECDNLSDEDLRLYDKIRESVEDDEDENDPLVYNPRSKSDSDELFDDSEEEFEYELGEYSDEDKY